MSEILTLLMIGLAAWWWHDGNRAREAARAAGREACRRAGVQFLDDSVAREWQALRRDGRGRIVLARQYSFEFASTGARRHGGRVHLLGRVVEGVELDPFEIGGVA